MLGWIMLKLGSCQVCLVFLLVDADEMELRANDVACFLQLFLGSLGVSCPLFHLRYKRPLHLLRFFLCVCVCGKKNKMSAEGSIEVILGCMFSGKTTDLMHEAKRAVIAGRKICFIIHTSETRYSREALNKSHDGLSMNVIRAPDLVTDPPEVAEAKVVFVDEGQFFPALGAFCVRQKRAGKHVRVAALTSNFNGDPWPEVQALVPVHADKITIKPAVCVVCKRDALYTRKIAGDMTQVVDVGGGEKYIPTCLTHLTEPKEVGDEVITERRLAVQNVQALINSNHGEN